MPVTPDPQAKWQDALLAARLIAMAGPAIGGVRLRAGVGPVRDTWLKVLRQLSGDREPVIIPAAASPDRLCGGIDIHGSLHAGRMVLQRGLLAAANGGLAVIAGAERLEASAVAAISSALDEGEVAPRSAWAGQSGGRQDAAFALIAIDEAVAGEPGPAPALCERLSMDIGLDGIAWSAISATPAHAVEERRSGFHQVAVSDALIETADRALGLPSPRRLHLTIRLARAIAALERRRDVNLLDVMTAVRLASAEARAEDQDRATEQQQPPPPEERPEPEEAVSREQRDEFPDEFDVAAALADINGLELMVERLAGPNRLAGRRGASGEKRRKARQGRVISMRERPSFPDARPDMVATLAAAAPWQVLRRREAGHDGVRPLIKPSDFRFRVYQDRRESAILFAVDASGSTAMDRLGEAKGAVELLLAECYAQRHQVGLVAFRGRAAESLLAPTRSLVRAKRSLQALPGGGATPLASGMKCGLELALTEKAKGRTPLLVLISDGSGNIALDGSQGREKAGADALTIARLIAHHRIPSMVIDIGRRGAARGQPLARAMGARYKPLPYASARSMSGEVELAINASGR
jgi:magnesium chelatase subunit D